MRRIIITASMALLFVSVGCRSIDKKAVGDIASASTGISAELQSYWDADVKAGRHEQAWADAKKAQMKAYLDAVTALQGAVK